MPAATCWDSLQLQSKGWKEVRELAWETGLHPGQGMSQERDFFSCFFLDIETLWGERGRERIWVPHRLSADPVGLVLL